ncbi:PREDICTED: uncharacterized protein LOC101301713 [Fragaria vesca subsp. vesca]
MVIERRENEIIPSYKLVMLHEREEVDVDGKEEVGEALVGTETVVGEAVDAQRGPIRRSHHSPTDPPAPFFSRTPRLHKSTWPTFSNIDISQAKVIIATSGNTPTSEDLQLLRLPNSTSARFEFDDPGPFTLNLGKFCLNFSHADDDLELNIHVFVTVKSGIVRLGLYCNAIDHVDDEVNRQFLLDVFRDKGGNRYGWGE